METVTVTLTEQEMHRIYIALRSFAREQQAKACEEREFAKSARKFEDEECALDCDAAAESAQRISEFYYADAEKISKLLGL